MNDISNVYETAIIGGGFSGAVAACVLSETFGEKIAVLERNKRIGKKIAATGNGRCNITNSRIEKSRYHSAEGSPNLSVLEKYGSDSLREWALSVGVPISFEGEKAYPCSRQASSVAEALSDKLSYERASVFYDFDCVSLVKQKDGLFVASAEDGRKVVAKNVILACGGAAGKQYGTDGYGYTLAKGLGHSVTRIYPSVVQLTTEREKLKGLKGVKVDAVVDAYVGSELVASVRGDVLFTDYGVSGNAIFSVSSYIVGRENASLRIGFLPEFSQSELSDLLKEKIALAPYVGEEKLLIGFVHGSVGRAVTALTKKIDSPYAYADALAKNLKKFTLKVTGTLGFDSAQVTRGGVRLSEINETTMESKLVNGLYMTGEILDVDGDCGGFNLQWAYSSARAAAEDILTK